MRIEIKISDWKAIAPGLPSKKSWYLWAQTEKRGGDAPPDFDLLPANLRRRMSLSSKLAVQISLSLSLQHQIDYAIFVSRHGELQRTCKLINEILSGEEASPIAFSQSVHNTASGLFTIASHSNIPVTSLAAGKDSFQQGLVETCARLNSAPNNKILLVYFDDVVPDVYSPFVDEKLFPFSLGLVMEKGDDWTIETTDKVDLDDEVLMPQALQFLQHYINEESQFTVKGTRHDWIWT